MAIIEFPLPICGAVVLSSSVSYCMSGNNIVIVLDLFFIGSLELFFLYVSWQNLKAHHTKIRDSLTSQKAVNLPLFM